MEIDFFFSKSKKEKRKGFFWRYFPKGKRKGFLKWPKNRKKIKKFGQKEGPNSQFCLFDRLLVNHKQKEDKNSKKFLLDYIIFRKNKAFSKDYQKGLWKGLRFPEKFKMDSGKG